MKDKKQNKKEKRNAVLCSIALQYSCASVHCFVAVLLFYIKRFCSFTATASQQWIAAMHCVVATRF